MKDETKQTDLAHYTANGGGGAVQTDFPRKLPDFSEVKTFDNQWTATQTGDMDNSRPHSAGGQAVAPDGASRVAGYYPVLPWHTHAGGGK